MRELRPLSMEWDEKLPDGSVITHHRDIEKSPMEMNIEDEYDEIDPISNMLIHTQIIERKQL